MTLAVNLCLSMFNKYLLVKNEHLLKNCVIVFNFLEGSSWVHSMGGVWDQRLSNFSWICYSWWCWLSKQWLAYYSIQWTTWQTKGTIQYSSYQNQEWCWTVLWGSQASLLLSAEQDSISKCWTSQQTCSMCLYLAQFVPSGEWRWSGPPWAWKWTWRPSRHSARCTYWF